MVETFTTEAEALTALHDQERPEAERVAAADALARMGSEGAIDAMFSVLESAEAGLGLALAEALRAMNAGAVLAGRLSSGDDEVRRTAALFLVRLGDSQTAEALIRACADPDAKVRSQVCQALARLEAPGVLDALRGRLGDPSPDVRSMAAYGVAARGAAADAAAVSAALDAEEDPVARTFLRQALRRLEAAGAKR
jgi:HEAT repeat protein